MRKIPALRGLQQPEFSVCAEQISHLDLEMCSGPSLDVPREVGLTKAG